MNKNQKQKLEAIMRKYESAQDDAGAMLCQTAFAISEDKGVWTKDGTPATLRWYNFNGIIRSSNKVIFHYDSDEEGLIGIKCLKNGKMYAFNDCDYQCQIADPDLIGVIEELAHISKTPKVKKAKKKTAKKYEIVFGEIYGKPIDCKIENAYAHIEAAGEEEARRFALEDMFAQEWTNVELNWSDDECEIEDGVWEMTFAFGMNGKHGEYGGVARVISSEFSEANDKALQTFKKGGMVVSVERPFFRTRELTD